MTKMTPKVTFRGWAGHFICADTCDFKLNTLIEYEDVKIVVSTVGLLLNPLPLGDCKYTTVGHNRYFETMAWHAELLENKFWDMDVSRPVDFESSWRYEKLDSELEATAGHYKVIEEICEKLKKGIITNANVDKSDDPG